LSNETDKVPTLSERVDRIIRQTLLSHQHVLSIMVNSNSEDLLDSYDKLLTESLLAARQCVDAGIRYVIEDDDTWISDGTELDN